MLQLTAESSVLDFSTDITYIKKMLRRKKLNILRRKRVNARQMTLNEKAYKQLRAKTRSLKKSLLESSARRAKEFREEYAKMIHTEPHISSPQSLKGIGAKKKSVLD